ncbi:histidine kinase [Mycobacterium sp. AT1]|uniref:sensor histidine kinase n=1 Tax=Mycobacterium sp. AT1 TaxID=1961706 RepID=UPI0013019E37|nr:histidine kinase [Mycobacterium sp. AT1]
MPTHSSHHSCHLSAEPDTVVVVWPPEDIVKAIGLGIAIVDVGGSILWVNATGAAMLGTAECDLPNTASPFCLTDTADTPEENVLAGERIAYVMTSASRQVALAYQIGQSLADSFVVTFRDVTEHLLHQRRIAALARTASNMASDGSVSQILGAMAGEIQQSDGVAGTQIITVSPTSNELQVMGSAGFAEIDTFFDLLMASHRRGATLLTYQAMDRRQQMVFPHRKAAMLGNPQWEPMHSYISQLDWDDFVSTPLLVRGKALGVVNVYIAANRRVGPTMLSFFAAMAEQAALAVDRALLIEQDRIQVRRDERKRLARDLHDSVVQQVFAIGMQASALKSVKDRVVGEPSRIIGEISSELADLSQAVQRDLRGVVLALQPSTSAELGFGPALSLLAEGVARRTGVKIRLSIGDGLRENDPEFVEDLYQIVSESIQNAVKHAAPEHVDVDVRPSANGEVDVIVDDDGSGLGTVTDARSGYGLTSMRDRVHRWSGSLQVAPLGDGAGTRVSAHLVAPPPQADQSRHRS